MLDITVETGESGPVVRLVGEADASVADQLSDALSTQLTEATRHLTVDLSGLRFADSAAIRILFEAHLALRAQGGTLELVDPQPPVARSMSVLGVSEVIAVRPKDGAGPA
jgi:anti-sigma B factor antagonist